MNIIAADDEALSLELLRRSILIACPDCTLACFSDAEELLAYARTHPADVAFLDIEMPGINGIELARELTALQSSLNLVFVTGYDCYTADALDLFASGYVLKPVSEAKGEAHRRYIDIQTPLTGDETYGVARLTDENFRKIFDSKSDFGLYDQDLQTFTLHPGEFAMFLPPRGLHAPGLTEGEPHRIRKLVVKVKYRTWGES